MSPLSPSTILPACLCWTLLGGWCCTLRNITQKTSIGGSSTEKVPLDHSDVVGFVFQDCTGFIALSRNEEYQNLRMRIFLFSTLKGGLALPQW
ncbi:uncharacterized protein HD556DRAFT_1422730 [Suillus plorans]|uniref:Secreted protein n=1 Tax=Suillus plorans TaxID=116603 RepID=A0A9P7AA83_9AGAM|nr:uncharacterized protein HD556DRAFT_1422730 [Suillus plorans]KAG1785359.1 hypothetical protein HD556DRAFT_1422730 [Suillus plorans]